MDVLLLSMNKLFLDKLATELFEEDKSNLPAKSFPLIVSVTLLPTVTVLLVTVTS